LPVKEWQIFATKKRGKPDSRRTVHTAEAETATAEPRESRGGGE
jgi:hypothetical protein